MLRCRVCTTPVTRPDTLFVDGVCSACRSHAHQHEIDWQARREHLLWLLRHWRGESGYDCVVASSGGKDSTTQVLDLLELGVRPLVVTATTCMLTNAGRHNIDVLKRLATTIEVSPHQGVRAKLNRLGLELVGDVSWPEHVAIFTTPLRVAVAMGIPLVFYGENPQRQYGGPKGTEDALQLTRRWVSEFGGFLGLRPADLVGQSGLTERDMADYLFPSEEELARSGTQAHFLGAYLGPWDSHRNAERARAAGMVQFAPSPANWWPFENLDNAMTGLHDHLCYRKYGYGRACAQVSVDIRNGLLTREQGMEIVRERDGLFPEVYAGEPFVNVLERLDMSYEQLSAVLDRFTSWDLFADLTVANRPILKEFAGA